MLLRGRHVNGVEVSRYGLKNFRLDYKALAEMLDGCIMNNNLINEYPHEWELLCGECENEIFQYCIITEYGYRLLEDYTDEMVLYNERLDIYLWCIDHFGTSWDHVLTKIELELGDW